MNRINERDGPGMVSAHRLISKSVTKALHFRKSAKNVDFEASKKMPSVKLRFGFRLFWRVSWSKVKPKNNYYSKLRRSEQRKKISGIPQSTRITRPAWHIAAKVIKAERNIFRLFSLATAIEFSFWNTFVGNYVQPLLSLGLLCAQKGIKLKTTTDKSHEVAQKQF